MSLDWCDSCCTVVKWGGADHVCDPERVAARVAALKDRAEKAEAQLHGMTTAAQRGLAAANRVIELEAEVERLTATVDILTRSLNSHVGSASAKKCPVCNGSGGWYDYSRASTAVHGNYQNCHGCGGKGWVTT